MFLLDRQAFLGSSPLMRGTRPEIKAARSIARIIPAYAGNTFFKVENLQFFQDHPRLCGEHIISAYNSTPSIGSSPLMRGTRSFHPLVVANLRIIPAYAGNTHNYRNAWSGMKDHPRLCGEHIPEGADHFALLGSSPLMRGTRI